MNEYIKTFLLTLMTVLATGIGGCIIKLLQAKIEQVISRTEDERKREFLYWVEHDVIEKCINTTTQTYVDALKESNGFDKESQKQAMDKTINSITTLLTEANMELLSTYVGDVTTWLTASVENYLQKTKTDGKD